MAGPADDVRSLGQSGHGRDPANRNDLPELMIEWTKYHQFPNSRTHPVTVNRMVAGSNPARGASQINHLPQNLNLR
jgi:hypothetical protein